MKHTCPKCGKSYDIGIKTVLGWIEKSSRLQKAAASCLGRIYRKRSDPRNQSRGPDAIKPAQEALKRKREAAKRKKINPSDLNL